MNTLSSTPKCTKCRFLNVFLWFATAFVFGLFGTVLTNRNENGRSGRSDEPSTTADVSSAFVKTLLRNTFPRIDVYITDDLYSLPTVNEIHDFLNYDDTESFAHRRNRHDCDDYSTILQGGLRRYEYTHGGNSSYAFAMAFGPLKTDPDIWHAFNLFIDNNHSIHLIEPQWDMIFTPHDFNFSVEILFM